MKLWEKYKASLPWLAAIIFISLLPFTGYFLSDKSLYASDQISSVAWKPLIEWLHKGVYTFWSPYHLAGIPTLDAIAGDFAYPPFLLASFLFPVERLVGHLLVLHLVWGALGAFFLMRRSYKIDNWLALALALLYGFNTYSFTLIYGGHSGKYYILSWLPWVFYFLRRSLQPAARWYHMLGLAGGVAVFLHTSHIQFTYFVLIGFFVYWLVLFLTGYKTLSKPQWLGLVPKFWVPVILGVGMAFYILYPPLKYNKEFSVRNTAEKTTMEHATSWSAHPEEIASLVVPEFGGFLKTYWGRNYFKLNSEYPGLAVLGLGLLALVLLRRKPEVWAFGLIALLAIIFSLGSHTPLFQLFFNYVPGIKNFRAPSMVLFWFHFSLLLLSASLLAQIALNQNSNTTKLALGANEKKRFLGWVLGSAGFLFLCGLFAPVVYDVWTALFGSTGPNMQAQSEAVTSFRWGALRAGVLWGGIGYSFFLYYQGTWKASSFGKCLLILGLIDLAWVNKNFIETYDSAAAYPKHAVLEQIAREPEPMRVFDIGQALQRYHLQYAGLESVESFMDNQSRLFNDFRGKNHQNNPNFLINLRQYPDGTVGGNQFLDLLAVKYIIFRDPQTQQVGAVLNRSVLPRGFFSPAYTFLEDSLVYENLKRPQINTTLMVYIAPEFKNQVPTPHAEVNQAHLADTSGKLVIAQNTLRQPNKMKYEVETPSAGVVFLSESFTPHWQVRVNGTVQPILRAYGALCAVYVGKGANVIELEYKSSWIKTGVQVALLSYLLLALFLIGWEYAHRKTRLPTN